MCMKFWLIGDRDDSPPAPAIVGGSNLPQESSRCDRPPFISLVGPTMGWASDWGGELKGTLAIFFTSVFSTKSTLLAPESNPRFIIQSWGGLIFHQPSGLGENNPPSSFSLEHWPSSSLVWVPRPIQPYHFQADLTWWDGPFMNRKTF
jgi:hypothetical protein